MFDSGPERLCRCRGPAARAAQMRNLRGVREFTGALSRARLDGGCRPGSADPCHTSAARAVPDRTRTVAVRREVSNVPLNESTGLTFGPTGEREGSAPAALMVAPARRMGWQIVEQCAVSGHRHLRWETRSKARPRERSSPEPPSTEIARTALVARAARAAMAVEVVPVVLVSRA